MPNYQFPYYSQFAQQQMPMQQQVQMPQMQPQIQNGGLVSVHNENEARNYPVGIGTSVTFKDENAPYIYNKTMGFSQLEAPKFDKYRLVKEEAQEASNLTQGELFDVEPINKSIDDIKAEIKSIWSEIEGIKNAPKKTPSKKKEVIDDDAE